MLDSLHIRIREARKKTGLSQKAMAEKLGVGHNCFANFERGETRLFNRCLYRLAEYLETSPEDLLLGPRPDQEMLEELTNWEVRKQQIIDEYEARTKALREELDAARREIADKDKTLESLRNTNKFLLDELGKQR